MVWSVEGVFEIQEGEKDGEREKFKREKRTEHACALVQSRQTVLTNHERWRIQGEESDTECGADLFFSSLLL